MLPHDVVREAARLIREGGHSQRCHARDEHGFEVPLFTNTRGMTEVDTSRAKVGKATAYSIYGAIAVAIQSNSTNPTPIWVAVRDEALRCAKSVPGGNNHLHPVMALNEHPDTTAEDAVAFLERVAMLLEPTSKQTSEVAANG